MMLRLGYYSASYLALQLDQPWCGFVISFLLSYVALEVAQLDMMMKPHHLLAVPPCGPGFALVALC